MAWVRLSDDFYDHPRFLRVGPLGLAMWATGVAWSNRNLTNGFLPDDVVPRLIDLRGCTTPIGGVDHDDDFVQARYVGWNEISAELTDAGLWITTTKDFCQGFAIFNYDKFQLPAEEILAKKSQVSALRSEAGRKGAQAKLAKPKQSPSKALAKPKPQPQPPIDQTPCPTDEGKTIDQLLFDAITTALSIDQYSMTGTARGGINQAVKQLKDAGADPKDVPARVGVYRRKYPNAACTPPALAKHWPALGLMVPVRRTPAVVVEPDEPVVPMTVDQLAKVRDSLRKAPDA